LIGVSESHQFGDMENDVGVTWPWMEHILCTATLVVIELGSELVEFEYGACVGYPSVVFEVRRALCHVSHDHAFEVGAGLFQYPQGAHTLALMWERIVDADRRSRLRLCGRGCTDHLPLIWVSTSWRDPELADNTSPNTSLADTFGDLLTIHRARSSND
jgi:hypothetical protein